MKWIITKDIINADSYDRSEVGLGRMHMLRNLHEERMAEAEKLPTEFRLLDDDGTVYFEGRCDDLAKQNQDAAFSPLDWAMNHYGCTEMQYRDPGMTKWETL